MAVRPLYHRHGLANQKSIAVCDEKIDPFVIQVSVSAHGKRD
jgi:hypothetical protein